MKQKEIVEILEQLKLTIDEYRPIRYESTDKKKELYQKISELYGSIQEYYLDMTGDKNIEVPVAGSQLKTSYRNYFEAGYLSGRTFHSHQGYTELLNIIGQFKSNKNFLKKKSLMQALARTEIMGIITLIITLLSGSFFLGKYIGENRFDQRKIDLTDENKSLKQDTLILKDSLQRTLDSLKIVKTKLTNVRIQQPVQELVREINISYFKPKSIFNGHVIILADEYKKEIEFKGVVGVDQNLNGEFKYKTIDLNIGDKFFIKLENNEIWAVNVVNLILGVDLELYKI